MFVVCCAAPASISVEVKKGYSSLLLWGGYTLVTLFFIDLQNYSTLTGYCFLLVSEGHSAWFCRAPHPCWTACDIVRPTLKLQFTPLAVTATYKLYTNSAARQYNPVFQTQTLLPQRCIDNNNGCKLQPATFSGDLVCQAWRPKKRSTYGPKRWKYSGSVGRSGASV